MSSKVVEANAKIHSLAMAVAVSFFGFSCCCLLEWMRFHLFSPFRFITGLSLGSAVGWVVSWAYHSSVE